MILELARALTEHDGRIWKEIGDRLRLVQDLARAGAFGRIVVFKKFLKLRLGTKSEATLSSEV